MSTLTLSSKPFIDTLLIETLLKDETVIAVFGSQSFAPSSDRIVIDRSAFRSWPSLGVGQDAAEPLRRG